jgi:hypothetical protein
VKYDLSSYAFFLSVCANSSPSQAKRLELEDSRLEKERLHRMVLETITEAEDKERMYELNRFHLESELALKTLQLTGVEGDVRSHVSVLTQRLDEVMSEKTAAEDSLRKEKQIAADLSREQSRKGSELAQAQRCVGCFVLDQISRGCLIYAILDFEGLL